MVSTVLQNKVHCRNTCLYQEFGGGEKKKRGGNPSFSLPAALGSAGKLLKGCSVL